MKILALNWRDIHHPEAGGAEVHLHEILKHLALWGHETTQLSSGFPGGAVEEEIDGVRIELRRGRGPLDDANVRPAFGLLTLA